MNTSIAGSYTLTYTAKDAAGNAATPVSRLVTVVDTDTTVPVITLLGDEDVSHPLGEDYEDAGATAEDAEDGEVAVVTLGADDLDVDTPGTYTLTYTASDAAGNKADPLTRTITIADQTAPQLVLLGDGIIELSIGDDYVEAGADATDNVDTTVNVSTSGTVDTSAPGNYTLTYTASDAAGNQATPLTEPSS